MKKFLAVLLTMSMTAAMLAGCGGSKEESVTDTETSKTEETGGDTASAELPKIACLLNGNLGDKSFFDSANEGMKLIHDELGCETNVIEMGFDNTVWETTLYEVSDQDWDIIIVGTYQMQEVLEKDCPGISGQKVYYF